MNQALWNEWIVEVGEHEAISKMVAEGLSPSTAERLARGTYKSQPGKLTQKVLSKVSKINLSELFPLAATKMKSA